MHGWYMAETFTDAVCTHVCVWQFWHVRCCDDVMCFWSGHFLIIRGNPCMPSSSRAAWLLSQVLRQRRGSNWNLFGPDEEGGLRKTLSNLFVEHFLHASVAYDARVQIKGICVLWPWSLHASASQWCGYHNPSRSRLVMLSPLNFFLSLFLPCRHAHA